jgi:murein endopeptidase
VEQAAVLWYLDGEALGRLQAEYPDLARIFTALVLKGAYCHALVDERKMLMSSHAIGGG